MHIHLDPLGGWSGDMFVAALLDAFPDHLGAVEAAVARLALGPAAQVRLVPHGDGTLTGRRFLVAAEDRPAMRQDAEGHHHGPDHHHHDHAHGGHAHEPHGAAPGHRAWSEIQTLLAGARLDPQTLDHALGIFRPLARAEAEVHGVDEADVAFHEVGAVDSIVDIVAAAEIMTQIGPATWSSAPLPLGSGRVMTQHGILPVPAPATALLMRGLLTIDDGIAGERVTPTGAAVARYLLKRDPAPSTPRRLVRSGIGFGSRRLNGISNCLRALVSEPEQVTAAGGLAGFTHRELGVVTFEVDDQSPEDLGNGLERIRALEGVHDVIQSVAFGKKNRLATQVQVLASPAALEAAIAACFTETTTIGLRFHTVQGAALQRISEGVEVDGRALRVKLVRRPDGSVTGKTEAADVAGEAGHAARARLRHEAAARIVHQEGHRLQPSDPGDRP